LQYVHQTSWGVSTRLIGSVIMVHGDDNGLVLPPYLAPMQVVIIPIQQAKKGVIDKARIIESELINTGIRVKVDDSDQSPGWKFAEYEMKGVPIRIEIGPRDIEQNVFVLVKRNDGSKQVHSLHQLTSIINQTLKTIHDEMYQKASRFLEDNTHQATTFEQFKKIIEEKSGYVKMMWCGNPDCEALVKKETTATARILPFDEKPIDDKCGVCGKKAEHLVIFAKAY
jgi:prolyl-tRNA synthetase